ncbi:hypothetical protein J2T17_002523 [Paenibacillus mucilaginosus]
MYSGFRRLEAVGDIEWYWAMNHRGTSQIFWDYRKGQGHTYTRSISNWEYAKRVLKNLL